MSDPSNTHSDIGALLTPQNSKFVINLKTARALGLSVTAHVARAWPSKRWSAFAKLSKSESVNGCGVMLRRKRDSSAADTLQRPRPIRIEDT
jgi:hypothetical protein